MEKKGKALIVEDKLYITKIMVTYLSSYFECVCVHSEDEMLSEIDNAAVVVMSDNICSLEGDSLLLRVKKVNPALPVVVMTSELSSKVRINYLKDGADDIVTKPFNPEELALRVRRLVK